MAEQYLIYLRKSRKDREQELQTGNHDTLERHRKALLALAKDRKLNVVEVLEEVVSGDTIAARPQMQRLLRLVETGEYSGVICMEIARLARGNTQDQGVVSETFRWSGTKIITPDKTYDPSDDADDDFFSFSLFLSRQEYKNINRRLNRGRMASLDEGKYIAGTAPYGYEKYKLPKQKGYSLRPNPETAAIVKRIFDLYTVGEPNEKGVLTSVGTYRIARRLNAEGIPSPGGTLWSADAVRSILKNPAYKGDLRWHWRPLTKRMENGVLKLSTPTNPNATIRKGIHEPLVSEEMWDKAQEIRTTSKHISVPGNRTQQNPLTGLLYCGKCGHAITYMLASGHNKHARYSCLNSECTAISHRADATEQAVLLAMTAWLNAHRLKGKAQDDDRSEAVKKSAAAVDRIRQKMIQSEQQQNRLYDLLEQGVYSIEVFQQRSKLLAQQMSQLQQELQQAEDAAAQAARAAVMWQNIIPTMEHVLQTYNFKASAEERNALLKEALEKVVYEKDAKGQDPVLYIYPKIPRSSNVTPFRKPTEPQE